MKQTRILLADDHVLLRRGLATLLCSQRGFSVVGEASNGQEAVVLTDKLNPDLVIMDLSMPVMDGVEATRRILKVNPKTRILLLTTFGTSLDVARAVQAGAVGALVKDTGEDELIAAIRKIVAGDTVFSPEIKPLLQMPPPPELSDRQAEVLENLVRGLASDAIAANLGITTNAVNKHIEALRKKLGAANRTEAVAIALRKHLLKI